MEILNNEFFVLFSELCIKIRFGLKGLCSCQRTKIAVCSLADRLGQWLKNYQKSVKHRGLTFGQVTTYNQVEKPSCYFWPKT